MLQYKDEETFVLSPMNVSDNFGREMVLRPETTKGTYSHVAPLQITPPFCFWQYGKSFRAEKSEALRPSHLRFMEFSQAEFQLFHSDTTKANYLLSAAGAVKEFLAAQYGVFVDVVLLPEQDTPEYSKSTFDLEMPVKDKTIEVASFSLRNDFPKKGILVSEFAFGMDRLAFLLANRNYNYS